jgi:hypothetical protein
MKATIALVLISFISAAQTRTDPGAASLGAVRGRVVDARDAPIKDALVSVEPTDGAVQGILRTATTDANGEFFLDQIREGENMVLASKVADFYPDARFAFFSTGVEVFPRVNISGGKTNQGVVVHLLHRGARLVGGITDSESGKPIITSRIILTRQDNPKLSLSTSPDTQGRFDIIVPSRPFVMQVSAPGYRTWSPVKENGVTAAILLQPESVKEELVELQREPSTRTTGDSQ